MLWMQVLLARLWSRCVGRSWVLLSYTILSYRTRSASQNSWTESSVPFMVDGEIDSHIPVPLPLMMVWWVSHAALTKTLTKVASCSVVFCLLCSGMAWLLVFRWSSQFRIIGFFIDSFPRENIASELRVCFIVIVRTVVRSLPGSDTRLTFQVSNHNFE
jgi:hypothetical protein